MTEKVSYYLPKGFLLGGVSAGIKSSRALDLGMIVCGQNAIASALTTTNRFCAAPVQLCRQRLKQRPTIRGVVVNSGNANAVTGDQGMRDAREMASLAESATGSPAGSFLVASTGIIGQRLPMEKISRAIPDLAGKVNSRECLSFADAIMTTDTRRKISSRTIEMPGREKAGILGMAKGVGMMEPNMATMLAFILTDFPLPPSKARKFLAEATDNSFHCLTVDGQTSTNDMVLLISSSGQRHLRMPPVADEVFYRALLEVCEDLSKQIVIDGEGATKLVTISVEGTNTRMQARRLAKEVANSMLVKTAIFGENPNWGRVLQALGKSGVPFSPDRVSVSIQQIPVVEKGAPVDGARAELRKAMKQKEISINIKIGSGKGRCRVWTCDLTDGYVQINAEYN